MTSANVIEYNIYKKGKRIGSFRKHLLCTYPDYAELLQYQPLKDHTIQAWGYDEEEEEWSEKPKNLEKFLKGMTYNKLIKAYFAETMTAEEAVKAAKDAQQVIFDRITANLKKPWKE